LTKTRHPGIRTVIIADPNIITKRENAYCLKKYVKATAKKNPVTEEIIAREYDNIYLLYN
tara:strand:+ start:449 stop:628 length:180 start_codon:yes stop_codon:yes gene_type:complete